LVFLAILSEGVNHSKLKLGKKLKVGGGRFWAHILYVPAVSSFENLKVVGLL
jgi:hypothetical protein